MADINVSLHDAQMEIFKSEARFKVISAGRRFGKSRLAAWVLLIKALKPPSKTSVSNKDNVGLIFHNLAKYRPMGSNAPVRTIP